MKRTDCEVGDTVVSTVNTTYHGTYTIERKGPKTCSVSPDDKIQHMRGGKMVDVETVYDNIPYRILEHVNDDSKG